MDSQGLERKMLELHEITVSYETILRTLKTQDVKP
jgi:hypothetical protein